MTKTIYVYSMFAVKQGRNGPVIGHAANALSVNGRAWSADAHRYALSCARQQFPPSEGWCDHEVSYTDVTDEFLYSAGWVKR